MTTPKVEAQAALALYERAYDLSISVAERHVAQRELDGMLRTMPRHALDLYYRLLRARRIGDDHEA